MNSKLPKVNNSNPWVIKNTKEVYDNAWINVEHHDVLDPSGEDGVYGKVHFKSIAIGVVPLTKSKETYLVGQYRYPVDTYSWEIPEGGCPLGSDPLDTAKRELKEETGLVADKWFKGLDKLWLSNSVSDEEAIFYIAQGLKQGESEPESTEDLTIWKLPFEDAYQMALKGEIRDVLSVLSLLQTKRFIEEGLIEFV